MEELEEEFEDDDELDEDDEDDEELDDDIRDGFIYILSNELMPNLYKVGFTSISPEEVAAEISDKSGLPKTYKVEKYWITNDPYIEEKRVHNAIADFAEGRGHFQGDLKKICAVIDAFIKTSNQDT